MFDQLIASLAILKVNYDKGQDYIGNFVPIVAESLRSAPRPEVSTQELQEIVFKSFGLRIPQSALSTILKRAAKRGYVKRTGGIYLRNDTALGSLPTASARAEVLRQLGALVRKLMDFCKSKYGIDWSEEEAEAALLSYLQEHSTPLLAAALKGEQILAPPPTVEHSEFLVNAFIAQLHGADPEGFKFLETIVKGTILANALLYPDLGGIAQKFERTEAYLDTKLVLRALGLTRPEMKSACRDLLELLYQQSIELRCFRHTYDEIWRILDACKFAMQDPARARRAYGDAVDFFIENKYTPSDIELLKEKLKDELAGLRITIKEKPAHRPELTVAESRLGLELQASVGYHSDEALQHDLDSLTGIHRLRNGEFPQRLESCRAIFITMNSNLVEASERFFAAEYRHARGAIPRCMMQQSFGTLVWLKKPLSAPELPRKRIIADCYAALNPSDSLWKGYLGEIDRLQTRGNISEQDFNLLRYSIAARTALMDLTFGDPETFTEETVEEVLEKAKAAAQAEVQVQLESERAKRLEAETRASQVEALAKAQHDAQLRRLSNLAAKWGLWISQLTLWMGFLFLALGIYVTLPKPFPELPGQWWKLITPVILLLFSLFTLFHLVHGTTLKSIVRTLEVRMSHFLERFLIRLIDPLNLTGEQHGG